MSLRASPIIRLLKPDASSIRFQPTSALSFSTNRVSKSASFFCASRPRVNDLAASRDEGALQDLPLSVDLNPICSEDLFDQIVAEAQVRQELVIVLWMASWCRKCIHLKPKLQKLAADYYPRLRFYCVDVNAAPHKLVCRAGVTLWKECKKQAEVIGGHKAYLVVNEIREMIENELSTS